VSRKKLELLHTYLASDLIYAFVNMQPAVFDAMIHGLRIWSNMFDIIKIIF